MLTHLQISLSHCYLKGSHGKPTSLGRPPSLRDCSLALQTSGNDGTFNVFLGQGQELYRLARRSINLGSAYNRIASFLPEVNGVPAVLDKVCNQVVGETNEWMSIKVGKSEREKSGAGLTR